MGFRNANTVIEVRNYSFKYASSDKETLHDVNLKFHEREITILVGPTGCGKSTLLKSLIGLIPHMYAGSWSGSVMIDGVSIQDRKINDLALTVGYVFQNPENQIFMFSVERDAAFGLENLGMERAQIRDRVDWAMSLMGITDLATKPPHELSDGQKQRAALAGILAMKPRVLILDEPTSLLDPHTALELIQLIRNLRDQLGITVIMVEHRLDLIARVADRLLVMENGTIVEDGKPREVFGKNSPSLRNIGIPTITRLYQALNSSRPTGNVPLTVDEVVDLIRQKQRSVSA